jgi:hypothetical protein
MGWNWFLFNFLILTMRPAACDRIVTDYCVTGDPDGETRFFHAENLRR